MNSELTALLTNVKLSEPGAEQEIHKAALESGVPFPRDYVDLMMHSDGLSGTIGNSRAVFWPIGELVELNDAYCVDDFAPGLVLFGSDGGNEGFAFDLRSPKAEEIFFVTVPLVGMELAEVRHVSDTFLGFVKALETGQWIQG